MSRGARDAADNRDMIAATYIEAKQCSTNRITDSGCTPRRRHVRQHSVRSMSWPAST